MITSRKKLLNRLDILTHYINYHQNEAAEKKIYLKRTLENSRKFLPFLLIATLVGSIKINKKIWFKTHIKQLVEIGSLTIVNFVKNEIIKTFKT